MINSKLDINIGNIIEYNYSYSNEESKIGLVYKIVKDLNFSYMLYLIDSNNQEDIVPFNILEYKIIN
tara:strand:+ start:1153 stop:1353 length:201 start_codon:yes stop_codon:yes gene_type:complete